MAQLSVADVGMVFADVDFGGVSFTLEEGRRLGVVGDNGIGKSTLLQCIAGTIEPTSGRVTRPRAWRLVHVDQSPPADLMGLAFREAVARALAAADRAQDAWRVDVALDSLGVPTALREREVGALSGGWQRLAQLARAWVADPDLILMDEPTNHLDLAKIIMLEAWLRDQWAGRTLVIVSHDRRFLANATDATLFLRRQRSRHYASAYPQARALLGEEDAALESRSRRDMREVERLRASAHHLRQIGVNRRSAKSLRKSIQIEGRAAAIENSLPAVAPDRHRDLRLAETATQAPVLVRIENATIATPAGEPLFRIGALAIAKGERAVVLGPNGAGKSRFIAFVRQGFESPSQPPPGLKVSPSARAGYLDQQLAHLPAGRRLHDHVGGMLDAGDQRATALLAQAGFPVIQQQRMIGALSPGERSRLALLAIRIEKPGFFLLDEPTNHLDIAGQEDLEREILALDAAMLLVSHDRTFVENTASRFLVIEDRRLLEIEEPGLFYRSLADGIAIAKLTSRAIPR